MPKISLTDRFVATVKASAKTDYFDSKTTSLGLRVSPSGVKAWSVMFDSPKDGKRARLSIGHYPQTSLSTARGRAIEARGLVEAGIDPRDMGTKPTSMTVADLIESYVSKHVRTLRSAKDTERHLRVDVLPVIGGVKLAELHRRDVHRVLDAIMERGAPQSARAVFNVTRAMCRWAVSRGDLDHNPLEGMDSPKTSEPSTRVLDDDEIRSLWHEWRPVLGKQVDLVLKLCLVTGQRSSEVAGMLASELDLAKRIWTLPGSRTKNKHEHKVPLSDLAVELIEEALADAVDDRVFRLPPHRTNKYVTNYQAKFSVRNWSTHDLRRTLCTHMVRLGVSPLIVGHVVNHRGTTKAGMTLAVYVQYSFDKEKREALNLWADRLTAIVAGDVATITNIRENKLA
jgi:integrase